MKKVFTFLCAALLALTAAACGSAVTAVQDNRTAADTPAAQTQAEPAQGKRVLVAYFSRSDENTGVGYIEKGNTRILAEMAADITKGDLFEIKTVKSYPKEYRPATEVAKQEKENNARPEINGPLPDMSKYDVIFLGYPIWWGDLPMGVYTFLERENLAGKTIIPFCTHEGSGLGNTERFIAESTKAKVLPGLEMRGRKAQNSQTEAKAEMEEWIKKSLADIK